jgi:thiol:disulfide interchange protein DsbD
VEFKIIKGISGLDSELAAAVGKPVVLDFYADWCISCKEMEHFTFSDARVQKELANFVLLKADVTVNDAQDKALNKRFGIFGPPAILFFDSNGREQRSFRVVGFMPAKEFSQHLKQVLR